MVGTEYRTERHQGRHLLIQPFDGEAGRLLYRGYAIEDLARWSTFEEVSYLLLYGQLPTAEQLRSFS